MSNTGMEVTYAEPVDANQAAAKADFRSLLARRLSERKQQKFPETVRLPPPPPPPPPPAAVGATQPAAPKFETYASTCAHRHQEQDVAGGNR